MEDDPEAAEEDNLEAAEEDDEEDAESWRMYLQSQHAS